LFIGIAYLYRKESLESNLSTNKTVNYSILAVNVGIIGAVFIFFAIAAQVPASTIFALDTKKCSFGFNILASHAQIGVVMVGGIIIGLFSISSVLALLHRGLSAVIATTAGFAVMFVAAILIVSSLACRLPIDFFMVMMLVVAVHMYSKRKRIEV